MGRCFIGFAAAYAALGSIGCTATLGRRVLDAEVLRNDAARAPDAARGADGGDVSDAGERMDAAAALDAARGIDAAAALTDAQVTPDGSVPVDAAALIDASLRLDAARPDASTSIVCAYHTATSGHDTSAGTAASPFLTIHKGASVLHPGETLCVHAGTYAEEFTGGDIPAGASWDAPVTIRSFPGDTVIIRPTPGADRVMTFVGPEHFIVIDGLTLDGTNVGVDAVKITYTGGSPTPSAAAHHIRLVRCEILDASDQGVLITGSPAASNNEILSCDIHHNGFRGTAMTSDHYHGIYVSTPDNVIAHNLFHDNAGYGVHVYDSSNAGVDRNVIAYNRIYHNGIGSSTVCSGGRACAAGVIIGSGSGNRLFDNLVYDNQGTGGGITVDYAALDSEVLCNTVYGNPHGYGISIGPNASSTRAVVKNNIVFGTSLGVLDDGVSTILANNLADGTDRRFVASGAADFHLLAGSPAIDIGALLLDVPDDFDAIPRPQGAAFDIGAFER